MGESQRAFHEKEPFSRDHHEIIKLKNSGYLKIDFIGQIIISHIKVSMSVASKSIISIFFYFSLI